MNRDQPGRTPSVLLTDRIRALENRIALRKAAAHRHGSALKTEIRHKMTSPLILLLAAGTGFAIGQLARPPTPAAQDGEAMPGHPDMASFLSAISAISSLNNLIGPITTIMTWLKPTTRPSAEAPGTPPRIPMSTKDRSIDQTDAPTCKALQGKPLPT